MGVIKWPTTTTARYLALFLTLIMILKSTLAANYFRSYCSGTTYSANSSFPTNLKTLLQSLYSNSATNPSGFHTAMAGGTGGEDTVYGLFLCRGDQNTDGCSDCVATAVMEHPQRIANWCPRTTRGIIWYDECMIKYDNQPVAGILDQSITKAMYNYADGWNKPGLVEKTMKELAVQAAYRSSGPQTTTKKYANKEVNHTNPLYSMVQCTPDLSASDCNKCMTGLISQLNMTVLGGRMYQPSCNVRYEIYNFLDTSFNSSSPSPPPPPPFPSVNTTNGTSGNTTGIRRKQSLHTSLLVVIPITGVTTLTFLCFGAWFCLRRREKYDIGIEAESLQFNLSNVRKATNNFSSHNKLGEGGFGEVYKGKFQNGQEVAVKRLSKTSGQGVVEFTTEAVLVAKLQHKNLVKLLGFCATSKEKILVYEYLANSSLDRYLFGSMKNASLDWPTRLNIMLGVARGLSYLHEDSRLKVIHRDLKASNVLLDEAWNPKISDFGLAKLFGVDQTQGNTNKIVGTYGYMAPEYVTTGHYSVKSDVYSFGVIVLEIVSGQQNKVSGQVQLVEALRHRAWRLWNEATPLDLVDPTLSNNFSIEEVLKCILIGLLCIQEDPGERPRMTLVVAALSGQSIDLPNPKPPHFFGWASSNENNHMLDEDLSPYMYTGRQTITDLYPRE